MAFDEVRFPTDISFGATGGPERRTDVVMLASGYEERNATWANSRRRYDAGLGVRTVDQVHAVIAFWEARLGRLYGFRWKDPFDFKSCAPRVTPAATDQAIGTGTGALTTFQLAKAYTSGGRTWSRTITKPLEGSVKIAVAGVVKTEGTHFTVNYATGVVTISSAPTNGQAVTAGFEFDTPVRFDMDSLQLSLDGFNAGSVPQIPVVEIRV